MTAERLHELLPQTHVFMAAEANLSVMRSLTEAIEQLEHQALEQCRDQ
jgi:hypothetical protein